MAGAKKEKTPACMGHDRGFRRNRGNSRGPTTIHRSINHSRLYLPSYLIARFAFFYLSSPFMDRPFRDFFVSPIPRLRLFFFFFFPLFHASYESLSRDFSARRENSFFDGFIDQEFVKEFHGSVKILMIERHENGFNRFVNSRNALQLILIDSFSFFFSRKRL